MTISSALSGDGTCDDEGGCACGWGDVGGDGIRGGCVSASSIGDNPPDRCSIVRENSWLRNEYPLRLRALCGLPVPAAGAVAGPVTSVADVWLAATDVSTRNGTPRL